MLIIPFAGVTPFNSIEWIQKLAQDIEAVERVRILSIPLNGFVVEGGGVGGFNESSNFQFH